MYVYKRTYVEKGTISPMKTTNVLEILVASVSVDCQHLYNKASRFAIRNNGRLVKTGPKWIEFKNTHPNIVMAILEDLIWNFWLYILIIFPEFQYIYKILFI